MSINRLALASLFIAIAIIGCATPAATPDVAAIYTSVAGTMIAQMPTSLPTSSPTPLPTKTPIPSPTPIQGTLNNPLPFNQNLSVTITSLGDVSNISLQVSQVLRGQNAYQAVKSANMFNDDPPKDMEFMLIKINVALVSGKLSLSNTDFSVASNGQLFDQFNPMVCCLASAGYPELKADFIQSGATTEGWVARPVFVNDPKPLLAYGVGYGNDISKALFISLTP